MIRSSAALAASLCLTFAINAAAQQTTVDPELAARAAAVPVSAFAAPPDFFNVKLSPTGEYLATVLTQGDTQSVGLLQTEDLKPIKVLTGERGGSIDDYWWAGPKRLIASPSVWLSWRETPVPTGELIGVDTVGKRQQYLYGYNNPERTDQKTSWAEVIDPLVDMPDQVLVRIQSYGKDSDRLRREAQILDARNGSLKSRVAAPKPGGVEFIADAQGFVRYASQEGAHHLERVLYARDPKNPDWREVQQGALSDLTPISLSKDERLFGLSGREGKPTCLVEYLAQEEKLKTLSCREDASVYDTTYSERTGLPISATYASGQTTIEALALDAFWQKRIVALNKAAEGMVPDITSMTNDDSAAVVNVYSDRDPGTFYLFDSKTANMRLLFPARSKINPELMGERRPISYAARDGTRIEGYLTLPPGRAAQQLPLVVIPHGGPFGERDSWEWDEDAQLLATRGYAVLQVNFRGSGGRGFNFIELGKQQWGGAMIDDITDGVRWTQKQGFTAEGRTCIFGWSYGGYASLMSAVREPELYRCTVAAAGIYDLKLFRSGGFLKRATDISHSESGRTYIEEFIGSSDEDIIKQSPLTYIDKLKAAVMIVHGKDDERVPVNQAYTLRKALDERHKPYEWFIKPNELHGFRSQQNREEFYTALLAFLDKHIGSAANSSAQAVTAAKP